MEESEIRALLEGAYALTPTLPENYLRYDEFRTCFNKLVEKRNNVPLDVEKLLESYYPKASMSLVISPRVQVRYLRPFASLLTI